MQRFVRVCLICVKDLQAAQVITTSAPDQLSLAELQVPTLILQLLACKLALAKVMWDMTLGPVTGSANQGSSTSNGTLGGNNDSIPGIVPSNMYVNLFSHANTSHAIIVLC